MSTKTAVMANYTEAIENLPAEAFLGSLCWFSISQADVHLDTARQDLVSSGLKTDTLRKNLRPVDAFKKVSRDFAHKFAPVDGTRSELMVRPVGEDGEQAYRQLILERAVVARGVKRRVFYEKVGEITFTRGNKLDGEYIGHSIEAVRSSIPLDLIPDEEEWLEKHLETLQVDYDHTLNFMDSHAVRTFVREYIYALNGTCVKSSGGIYFVKQEHVEEIGRLATWVKSVGSEFHFLPLLNLADQRGMILQAFEEESVAEIDRLMGEVAKILDDPSRSIEAKTFDAYANKAAELGSKIQDYSNMLGARAGSADKQLEIYTKQVMTLAQRIRSSSQAVTVTT